MVHVVEATFDAQVKIHYKFLLVACMFFINIFLILIYLTTIDNKIKTSNKKTKKIESF